MQPKYQVIAAELRARILAGVYNGVKMLPTENSLMDDFSVSRQTIRQALSVLVEEGYISKRRGSGSYIRLATEPRPAFQRRTVAVVTTYTQLIFPSILREISKCIVQKDCIPALCHPINRYRWKRGDSAENLLGMSTRRHHS